MLAKVAKAALSSSSSSSAIIKGITVLGIESSCDDSCAALVRYPSGEILRDIRISQFDTHAPYGGIMPNLAVREHEKNMPLVLERCLHNLSSSSKPDLIAVSTGPGMKACLRVGMNHALRLGEQYNIPVLGINHLEAHTLVARRERVEFPYLCLLVSGGHSCVSLVLGPGHQQELGSTLDDAMGEAFDKVNRQLVGENVTLQQQHGGAALEQLAKQGKPLAALQLPVALRKAKSVKTLDFSFSGLKASTSRAIAKQEFAPADIALAFQTAAVQHCRIVVRNMLAAHPQVNTLVICGGVASNQALRTALSIEAARQNTQLCFPPPALCVDNGVMVAWAGAERYNAELPQHLVTKDTNPRARWPLSEL